MLTDPDRDVRATALNALVGLGVDDAAALSLAALDDDDGFVRATAAKLLGDLDDVAFAEPLARQLTSDSDASARQRAAESLERIGGDVALAGLIRGLGDPMERVRMASVKGVSELGADRARPELARLLREDVVWEIRAEAAHALGITGHPEALAELEAAREDPNEFVRSAVANAIRIHGEVEAPPGL
jgi:HEAT repeat protein